MRLHHDVMYIKLTFYLTYLLTRTRTTIRTTLSTCFGVQNLPYFSFGNLRHFTLCVFYSIYSRCSKNGTYSIPANIPPGRGTNRLKRDVPAKTGRVATIDHQDCRLNEYFIRRLLIIRVSVNACSRKLFARIITRIVRVNISRECERAYSAYFWVGITCELLWLKQSSWICDDDRYNRRQPQAADCRVTALHWTRRCQWQSHLHWHWPCTQVGFTSSWAVDFYD